MGGPSKGRYLGARGRGRKLRQGGEGKSEGWVVECLVRVVPKISHKNRKIDHENRGKRPTITS